MADRDRDLVQAPRNRFDANARRAVRDGIGEYDHGQHAVLRDLRVALRGRGAEQVDQRLRARLVARIRRSQLRAAKSLADQLAASQAAGRAESLRSLVRSIGRMEGSPSALEESPRFQALLTRKAEHRAVRQIAVRQTAAVSSAMEDAITLAAAEGRTVAQTIRDLERVAADQSWRIERVVRTESAFSYNTAIDEGIDTLSEIVPGLRARWTEHVDDATWTPMDDRVAADSLALHGQVKRPGGYFVMPSSGPADLVGKVYETPPNRPNDRAVLTPWRKAWGIPAYEVRDGRKVWLVRRS